MANKSNSTQNVVIFGTQSTLYNTTAAYARVSTPAQVNDGKLSIVSQLEAMQNFVRICELEAIISNNTITEVNRGHQNVELEKFLRSRKCLTLFVYDATRFVRSHARGNRYLDIALRNQITIVFMSNELIWNPNPTIAQLENELNPVREKLLVLFRCAEEEPRFTSIRLTRHMRYCRDHFLAGGGRVPYGYKVIQEYDRELGRTLRRVVPHEYQMLIIQFIKCARTSGSDLTEFNEILRRLVEEFNYYRNERYQDQPFDAYQFYDEYDIPTTKMRHPMTYSDIASILNQNGIMYKNVKTSKWSVNLVRTAAGFIPYNERQSIADTRRDRQMRDISRTINVNTISIDEDSADVDADNVDLDDDNVVDYDADVNAYEIADTRISKSKREQTKSARGKDDISELLKSFKKMKVVSRSGHTPSNSSQDCPAKRTRSKSTHSYNLRSYKKSKTI
jgi:DNA invertase Pin-like site-specific DNA recombinase